MKFNKILLMLFATFATSMMVVSCSEDALDNEQELEETASMTTEFTTNLDPSNIYPIYIPAKSHVTLTDISKGAVTHQWQAPATTGVYYLVDDVPDGEITDYADLLSHTSIELATSTEDSVNLYFENTGSYSITLRNQYTEPITCTYYDTNGTEKTATATSKLGEYYVMELPITVTVLATTLFPSALVYTDEAKDETCQVETGSECGVEIYIGDKLYLVDNSTGNPNTYSWECAATTPTSAVGSEVAMTFTSLAGGDLIPTYIYQTVERVEDPSNPYLQIIDPIEAVVPLEITVKDIVAQGEAYWDADCTTPVEGDSVDVYCGDALYFKSTSLGGVNINTWNCPSAAEADLEGEVVEMFFGTATESGSPVRVTLTAQKVSDPESSNPTVYSIQDYELPLDINVGVAQVEFNLASATYNTYEKTISIQIADGDSFGSASVASVQNAFTLAVTNTYDGASYAGTATSTSVELDADDSSILNITFDAPLYNTDDMLLSYTSSDDASLTTSVGKALKDVVDYEVFVTTEMLPISASDFGSSDSVLNYWSSTTDAVATAIYELSIVDDPDGTDNKCLKNVISLSSVRIWNTDSMNLPAGTYTSSVALRTGADEIAYGNGINYNLTNESVYNNNDTGGNLWISTNSLTADTWVTKSTTFTITEPVEGRRLCLCFNTLGSTFAVTFYFKEMSLQLVQVRE